MTQYKQQTTKQVEPAIRIGSVKLELGATLGALVDVGALRDASMQESWTRVRTMSDNAGIIEEGIRDHIVTIKGTLLETNLENLGIVYSGVATHSTVAAAPVSITEEEHTLTLQDFSAFTHRNGDRTEVASIVVTDSAGAVTLVRDCDYLIAVLANGFTGIARAYPTAIITAQTTVDADTTDDSFNDSGSGFAEVLAPGDHIIVAGFTEAANNGVHEVVSATNAKIVVTTNLTTEAAGDSVTITRGGIASGDTVKVDYDYTPLSSRTYKTGGKQTLTPNIARMTNLNIDDKAFRLTVWKCTPEEGINFTFPADNDADPLPCPITLVGQLDTDRTSGDQLFEVYDEQHAV